MPPLSPIRQTAHHRAAAYWFLLLILLGALLFVSPLGRAAHAFQGSVKLFEENFTSDNSPTGQTAPTIAQLAARGWKDGISSIGTGYLFERDATLGKQVMYAHWTQATGQRTEPDGTASGWKKFFSASRDVTLYAVVKFHNVANSPNGAHWHRFFNWPGAGDFSPGNAAGQMDLDVSGRDKLSNHYDPITKVRFPDPQQQRGFLLYAGGNLSYSNAGAAYSNTYKDDVWYELAWYLKANTTVSTNPQATGNGQMKVLLRPLGTTPWKTVFDGVNFNNSQRADPINFWMIGPYMDRWTADIRHYYSRAVVWSGDAITNGTLDAFLSGGTPTPPDTTAPVLTFTSPSGASVVQGSSVLLTVTANESIQPATFTVNGAAATSPYTFATVGPSTVVAAARDLAGNVGTVTKTVLVTAAPPSTPDPVDCRMGPWVVTSLQQDGEGYHLLLSRPTLAPPANGGKACGPSTSEVRIR